MFDDMAPKNVSRLPQGGKRKAASSSVRDRKPRAAKTKALIAIKFMMNPNKGRKGNKGTKRH